MTAVGPAGRRPGTLLAIDTATAEAVVAIGTLDGALVDADRWVAGHRHGEELIPRVGSLLARHGLEARAIDGIVVGLGPGAFTGLRVGLSTAKTLAHELARPIVGVGSGAALIAAGQAAGLSGPLALLLPAGPSDRILVTSRDPDRPVHVRADDELRLDPGTTIMALDLAGRADVASLEHGARALDGFAASLLQLGARRVASGATDDPASLVPEYVTLPRGVRAMSGEVAWSRDHR
jgi:tRNA threonylcarbamoyl adenosine modification protein YeaZ